MTGWDWEAFIRKAPDGQLYCGVSDVLVRDVVEARDAGMSKEAILRKFPTIRAVHMMAAFAWAENQENTEKITLDPKPSDAA